MEKNLIIHENWEKGWLDYGDEILIETLTKYNSLGINFNSLNEFSLFVGSRILVIINLDGIISCSSLLGSYEAAIKDAKTKMRNKLRLILEDGVDPKNAYNPDDVYKVIGKASSVSLKNLRAEFDDLDLLSRVVLSVIKMEPMTVRDIQESVTCSVLSNDEVKWALNDLMKFSLIKRVDTDFEPAWVKFEKETYDSRIAQWLIFTLNEYQIRISCDETHVHIRPKWLETEVISFNLGDTYIDWVSCSTALDVFIGNCLKKMTIKRDITFIALTANVSARLMFSSLKYGVVLMPVGMPMGYMLKMMGEEPKPSLFNKCPDLVIVDFDTKRIHVLEVGVGVRDGWAQAKFGKYDYMKLQELKQRWSFRFIPLIDDFRFRWFVPHVKSDLVDKLPKYSVKPKENLIGNYFHAGELIKLFDKVNDTEGRPHFTPDVLFQRISSKDKEW